MTTETMSEIMTQKRVLVLLIGEVLEDPRVYKTCRSLMEAGASVRIICTNPSGRVQNETADGLLITRVPHYTESFSKRLYNRLQKRGGSSIAVAASRLHEEVPSSRTAAFVRNAGVLINHRHVIRETKRIGRKMIAQAGGEHFDLVHANDVDTLPVGAHLKAHGNADTLLYDAHEFWSGIGVHGSLPNRDHQRIENRYIMHADYVVTVNSLIAERMQELYELPVTPAAVMNCPLLHDAPGDAVVAHTPVRVLYQGKLQAFRGLEELVLALKELPQAILTFSGYGPIEDRLRAMVDAEGLTDRVSFAGRFYPDETIRIAAQHDIGVLPFSDVTASIRLSSPNKLFDYLMAGLAIAARDLPFLSEMVNTHNVGTVFNGNSPSEIARAIQTLSADHEYLSACRSRAHNVARSLFTWESQFADQYPWKP